jgi:oxygen-independent coproporphyrinogen-3 oxidase
MEYKADNYLKALKKEITLNSEKFDNYIFDTIFIGGGTPSILNNNFYLDLYECINNNFKLDKDLEFTIETNPGTLTSKKAEFYYSLGINRISMGLQAWQKNILRYLGRIHTIEDFKKSYNNIINSGFTNINVDLIFGIYNQTMSQWKETLDNVLSLDIKHISAYSLKIEENTKFGQLYNDKKIEYLSDELEREMYYICDEKLNKYGFTKYEISNYSIEGFKCRHNLNYWKCGEYLGIGLGAHSYINNERLSNITDLNEYLNCLENKKSFNLDKHHIDRNEQIKEFIILGLRLKEGISTKLFKENFNKSIFELYSNKIEFLKNKGLIEINNEFIVLTKKGFDLANQVFLEFI